MTDVQSHRQLSDDDFLAALADGSFPSGAFQHGAHLRLAWVLFERHGPEAGGREVMHVVQPYADAIGAHEMYNATLTGFWLEALADARARHPDARDLDELRDRQPDLADPGWQYRYWRRETLKSDEARRAWRPPDLAALPW